MKTTITPRNNVFIFGLPMVLLLVLVLLMKYAFLMKQEVMSYAVSIDLLLTVPAVYCLLIYKTNIPKTTTVPAIIIGFLLGTFFLPKESQTLLVFFKRWCLPLIEAAVLVFVIAKLLKSIKVYRRLRTNNSEARKPTITEDKVASFYSLVYHATSDVLPERIARPLATEIAVLYYGFFSWKKRQLKDNMFSYHKKSGTDALLGVFIFTIAIETLAVHLLLERWNIYAAWILTGLSIYTMIQTWGFLRSLAKIPICLDKNELILNYGIMNTANIPYTDIDAVSLSRKSLKEEGMAVTLSFLGELEKHNVVIKLKKECTLIGLYGRKKRFTKIGLHIDEPDDFTKKLTELIALAALDEHKQTPTSNPLF